MIALVDHPILITFYLTVSFQTSTKPMIHFNVIYQRIIAAISFRDANHAIIWPTASAARQLTATGFMPAPCKTALKFAFSCTVHDCLWSPLGEGLRSPLGEGESESEREREHEHQHEHEPTGHGYSS
jgi:hypothetical protein